MADYSGRFVLRIPPDLHARATRTARELGVSLNEHCRVTGDDLESVVLFGSQARGDVLEKYRALLPEAILGRVAEFSEISRSLRRDRELAFTGSEDLTPSQFYRKTNAETALSGASLVVPTVTEAVGGRD